MSDPVMENSWMAGLNAADLVPSEVVSISLLDQDIVVWRSGDGSL